jgi:hypothetical protein
VSHRILANCRGVKDFGDSGTPKTGPGLVGQFWGLDSDRILKLVLREIILSHKQLTSRGLSDAQIQLISGHESKKSLEVYQHLSLESVDKAYQDAVQSVGI